MRHNTNQLAAMRLPAVPCAIVAPCLEGPRFDARHGAAGVRLASGHRVRLSRP
ncbi:MAG: hypothetical protein LBR27_01515 [Bifidobacteriaceae bacterium]|jgi:hypothetical protein|nr:hypothetical protein [Bifidobacteriaceae bacterium]